MTSERIKEIQQETPYPESVSVYKALLKVWNECEQSKTNMNPSIELVEKFTLITSVSHPTNVQIYKSAQQCAQIAIDYSEEQNMELRDTLRGLVLDVGNLLAEEGIEWQQAGYYTHAKELLNK